MSGKINRGILNDLNHAVSLHQTGRLAEAEALYRSVLKVQPRNFDAAFLLGVAFAQRNNFEAAKEFLAKAVRIKPEAAEAHYNLGLALHSLGLQAEALESYNRTIKLQPDHAVALHNRGAVLHTMKRHEEAVGSFERALKVKPGYVEAHYNRGIGLQQLGRYAEAVESFDRALAIKPADVEALYSRAAALNKLERFQESLEACDRALAVKPDSVEAHYNRGNALAGLKRPEDAVQSYNRAIQIKPDHPDSYQNRGVALAELNRFEEALQSHDRAIHFRPDFPEAYSDRGHVLGELKRFEDALQSFDRAIEIKPDSISAYIGRADIFGALGRWEEAIDSYDKAIEIKPDCEFVPGDRLFAGMKVCSWSNHREDVDDLLTKVSQGKSVSNPFPLLGLTNAPDLQCTAAKTFVNAKCPISHALPALGKYPRHDKIRIGYFSADFCIHPMAILSAELFERHDRSRFEVTAFSFGPDTRDDMRRRLEPAFDKFIDVRNLSNRDVAMLARNFEIDIAVDLMGFTQNSRASIFAMRAAPVQVNYLGYAGTMGADYIDYLIADPVLIPAKHRAHYVEKIAYLPHCYMPNDSTRAISNRVFTRAELGLPDTGFVFCCFNNSYKITPAVFDCWMAILRGVEGSVLWLSENNAVAAANLKKEAARLGIDPNRLIFASRMPSPADHLARHRVADLFLDTLPYNAHATANDALWAGLPVLTLQGETFAGRVAASLLTAIGLPELIQTTQEDYVGLATSFAVDPDRLQAIKLKLACNRLATPLFDIRSLTGHIEDVYATMYERHMADSPRDHIHLDVGSIA